MNISGADRYFESPSFANLKSLALGFPVGMLLFLRIDRAGNDQHHDGEKDFRLHCFSETSWIIFLALRRTYSSSSVCTALRALTTSWSIKRSASMLLIAWIRNPALVSFTSTCKNAFLMSSSISNRSNAV